MLKGTSYNGGEKSERGRIKRKLELGFVGKWVTVSFKFKSRGCRCASNKEGAPAEGQKGEQRLCNFLLMLMNSLEWGRKLAKISFLTNLRLLKILIFIILYYFGVSEDFVNREISIHCRLLPIFHSTE